MGIKQLNKIIKKYSPNAIKELSIQQLKGKKIALDSPILLYKYRYAAKGNGSHSHIHGFVQRVCFYLKHGILPIFVFDGIPPNEKKEILNKRTKQKAKIEARISALMYHKLVLSKSISTTTQVYEEYSHTEMQEFIDTIDPQHIDHHIDKLNRQVTYVTKTHRHQCKYLLKLLGIPVIEANGEAENTCAHLQKEGIVDYTFTEDSDALTFGAPKVLKSAKKIEKVTEIDLSVVLEGLELDMEQFVDFCILSGCDYCNTIPSVGPITSLNLIREFGNIETILEVHKDKYTVPDNFDYKTARVLFNQNPLDGKIDRMSLGNIDKCNLQEFIVNELKLGENTYKNIVRKVTKSINEYNKFIETLETPKKENTLLNYFNTT